MDILQISYFSKVYETTNYAHRPKASVCRVKGCAR